MSETDKAAMTPLTVEWVDRISLFDRDVYSERTRKLLQPMVPVIRLKDLDALREGLEIAVRDMVAMPPDLYREWLDSGQNLNFRQWLAQRLLALLPTKEGAGTQPDH